MILLDNDSINLFFYCTALNIYSIQLLLLVFITFQSDSLESNKLNVKSIMNNKKTNQIQ